MTVPARVLVALLAWACLAGAGATEKENKGRNPYYGAIAHHAASKSVGWATDRRTSREARLEALKHCGHPECVIAGTVTRGCAALASGAKGSFLQKGTTGQEAQTKAMAKCGAGCEIAAWTCTR